MSFIVLNAPDDDEPTYRTDDLQKLYDKYKESCEPVFRGVNNVREMEEQTFERMLDALNEEVLDQILEEVQDCLVRRHEHRYVYDKVRGDDLNESHLHVLKVLEKLWRVGTALKKSMRRPMILHFIERSVQTFGPEHKRMIRRVSIIVHEHHDDLCTQFGVNPETEDMEELKFVAECLVSGFDSFNETGEDPRPITPQKFYKLFSRL